MNKTAVIAAVLAISAGGANYLYARNLEQNATGGKKVGVLVASKDLKQGETLNKSSFALRHIPVAFVDDRDVRGDRISDLDGAPIQVSIKRGQVIQWTDFQSRVSDMAKDLADLVQPGKRAMTIVVNQKSALGGLLRPGHRVDIVGTFTGNGSNEKEQRSQVMLQNVVVLATGKQLSSDSADTGFNTVTLSVTVEQSELLSLAGALGSLSLVLRGYSDLAIVNGVPPKDYNAIAKLEANSSVSGAKAESTPIERLTPKK
ncbi:MAG: Flp pilus assembly protein CpaB [Deltaproteobacteria bacterium]|nr:Flp pilus assembly protein CpaB [Deltaproteobacteria bacterium]